MKEKLFTSINSKKGIFLEIEGEKLKASVWKKETPISVELDIETAFQMFEFVIENLRNADDKDKNDFWRTYIKNFIDDRVNQPPPDLEEREKPKPAETISFNESKHDWSPKKKPKAPLVPSAPKEFSISLSSQATSQSMQLASDKARVAAVTELSQMIKYEWNELKQL